MPDDDLLGPLAGESHRGSGGFWVRLALGGQLSYEDGNRLADDRRWRAFAADGWLCSLGLGLQRCQCCVQSARRGLERTVLPQHGLFEPTEAFAGLHPQFLDQNVPRLLERFECLGLPSAAIQGEHQLTAGTLAERVLADERLELGNHLIVLTQREPRFDDFLTRVDPKLLEPSDSGLRERLVGEFGQRLASPERFRLPEHGQCLSGVTVRQRRPGALIQTFETIGVELIDLQLEDVAGGPRDQAIARPLKRSPKPRDEDLQRVVGGRRGRLSPDLVYESINRNDLVGVKPEHSEDRALTTTAKLGQHAIGADLDGPKDPELELRPHGAER
jgi:hypothetical protein